MRALLASVAIAMVARACARPCARRAREPVNSPDSQLEPTTWTDIAGWMADDHSRHSPRCRRAAIRSARPGGDGIRGRFPWPLAEVCRRAAGIRPVQPDDARAFFEENFRPVRISPLGETEGFLTGYYEPIVDGSRFPVRNSTCRSIGVRAISSRSATSRAARASPTRGCKLSAAMPRTRSSPIMIAAPSRMARWTARSSKSAG